VNIDLDKSVQNPKKPEKGVAHQHPAHKPSCAIILEKTKTNKSATKKKRKLQKHASKATILSATAKAASFSSRLTLKVTSIFSRMRCVNTRFLSRVDMVTMGKVCGG
jgi:hypothetical protein